MAPIIEILKRHAFFIVCGVVAALGIVLGAVGLGGMPTVAAELETAQRMYSELGSLTSDPVNMERLEAEDRRITRTRADREKVLTKARQMAPYEQLLPGFFPACEYAGGLQEQFLVKYTEAINDLLPRIDGPQATDPEKNALRWGLRATDDDIEAMGVRIGLEQLQHSRGATTAASIHDPNAPRFDKGWTLTKSAAAVDKTARANMAASQRINVFALRWDGVGRSGRASSLDLVTLVPPGKQRSDRLDPQAMWRAQVQLWIQKDVLDAVARLNARAAQAPKAGGEGGAADTPWLGIMPVKEIVSIRVADYVEDDPDRPSWQFGRPGGENDAKPSGFGPSVFTQSISSPQVDVVQFSVKLVMDQRDLLAFVDELTRDRFHTLLHLSYRPTSNIEEKTFIYDRVFRTTVFGSEPSVSVVLDFETILPAEPFHRWMPDEVLAARGLTRPEDPAAVEDGV